MSGIVGGAGSKSGVIGQTEIDYEEGSWVPNNNGGSIRKNITSAESKPWKFSAAGNSSPSSPITSPTSTRAIVYGNLIQRTAMATRIAKISAPNKPGIQTGASTAMLSPIFLLIR